MIMATLNDTLLVYSSYSYPAGKSWIKSASELNILNSSLTLFASLVTIYMGRLPSRYWIMVLFSIYECDCHIYSSLIYWDYSPRKLIMKLAVAWKMNRIS